MVWAFEFFVVKPAAAVLASMKRHPVVWGLLFLVLLLVQVNLITALFQGMLWVGGKLGEKADMAIRRGMNWLFRDEARFWWILWLLWIFLPPLGFLLLLWHLKDKATPGPELKSVEVQSENE